MTVVTGRGRRREPGVGLAALGCTVLLVLAACSAQGAQEAASLDERAVATAEDEDARPAGAGRGQDPEPVGAAEADHGEGPEAEPAAEADGEDSRALHASEAEAPAEPRPVTVEIPAIGVRADLVPLGLNDDGSMEVPDFGLAGWYAKGPMPGEAGPSVIAAHYDSTDGPDVFYDLGSLEAGDEIRVHREDGSVATFVVEDLEQHPKEELPGDRIWARSAQPRLTLITCGGVFDRATGHYTDNVIAYATGR